MSICLEKGYIASENACLERRIIVFDGCVFHWPLDSMYFNKKYFPLSKYYSSSVGSVYHLLNLVPAISCYTNDEKWYLHAILYKSWAAKVPAIDYNKLMDK